MSGKEKVCSRCDKKKLYEQFSKSKAAKDGYQSCCKVCANAYKKTDRGREVLRRYRMSQKNKDAQKRYRQTDKGKEVHSQACQRYRKTDKWQKRQKRFWQSDKGHQARRRSKATRRTNETQAGGSYSANEWYQLCKFYDFRCLRCCKKLPFEELTLDHIKPVSKGGSSFIWNVQPLCRECNRHKGTKEIDYRQTLPNWINRNGLVWQQSRLF